MVAKSRFRAEVVVSDGDQSVVELARANVDKNDVRADVIHLDWEAPPKIGPFDLVIGADVAHLPEVHDALADCLDAVTAPGSTVLISRKRRQDDKEQHFFATILAKRGFSITQRICDDPYKRYKKYGRLAHDSDGADMIELVVLEKE